jgi:hypothetical protein
MTKPHALLRSAALLGAQELSRAVLGFGKVTLSVNFASYSSFLHPNLHFWGER